MLIKSDFAEDDEKLNKRLISVVTETPRDVNQKTNENKLYMTLVHTQPKLKHNIPYRI